MCLLRVGVDIDSPAGQTSRQTGILSLLADSKRELVVGHHNVCTALVHVQNLDTNYLGGRQRVTNELRRILVVVDDVNLCLLYTSDAADDAPRV